MSGKLRIILLVVLAGVSFAAAYFASVWRPVPPPPAAPAGVAQTRPAGLPAPPPLAESVSLSMKEAELDELIKEVRGRLEECRRRQEDLDKRDARMRMAAELLKKQAAEMETLRMQLVSPLARLKEAKAELDNTRLRIAEQEKANLKRTAAIYEKMDASAGGRILGDMCQNKQEDDAVKILRYMSERAAAKLLTEIPDKSVASRLCEKMKRVQEEG